MGTGRRRTSTPREDSSIPRNVEAEEAVLGSILIDGGALRKVAVFLRSEHFYVEKNAWIYQAFLALAERDAPIDVLTGCDELERQGWIEEAGGAAYVTSLLNAVPTALHVVHYARLVERAARLRHLIAIAGQVARLAYECQGPAGEAERQALALLQALRSTDSPSLPPRVGAVLENLDTSGDMALTTGLGELDARWQLLRPGVLVVLAAPAFDAGVALAYQVALHQALRETPVLILSPRQGRADVCRQLWGQVAGCSPRDLEAEVAGRARDLLSRAPLYVDDSPILGVTDLEQRIGDLRRALGIRLAIVDCQEFLQFDREATGGSGMLPGAWRRLKQAARATGTTMLLLTQARRRSGRSLAAGVDAMLLLTSRHDGDGAGRLTLHVSAQPTACTNGASVGQVDVWFQPSSRRFSCTAPQEAKSERKSRSR